MVTKIVKGGLGVLALCALQACNVGDGQKITSGETETPLIALQKSAIIDTNLAHQVADDKTAGRNPQPFRIYHDAETKLDYPINQGWHIMQRQAPVASAGQPKTAAVGNLIQTWTDMTGTVETRVYECITPTAASRQSIGCQVEAGFLLTGGGAYVDYGTGQGALLWESRPVDDGSMSTWIASSKDHYYSCPHILHVYAFGMRLKDKNLNYIDPYNLTPQIFNIWSHTSSPASHAPSYVMSDPNQAFFGGGAHTNWSTYGVLLTSLYVNGNHIVSVAGKDHAYSDPNTITAYSIVAPMDAFQAGPQIPNFGRLTVQNVNVSGTSVPTGVSVAYATAQSGWVITGPGGTAQTTSGPGRLLFGVKPTGTYQPQIAVYAKDHVYTSAGYSTVNMTIVAHM